VQATRAKWSKVDVSKCDFGMSTHDSSHWRELRFNRSQRLGYQALCQDSIVNSQMLIQIRHSCLIEPNSFMTDLLITFRIIRSTNTLLWKLYPLPRPHARQPPAKLRYLSWRQHQPPRCLLLLLIHPYHSHLHMHLLEQRGRRRRRRRQY
jgi:hypothetical protein